MGTRLFVGNLSFDTTESSLTTALTRGGQSVSSVSIVSDRATGRSRGFAFVELDPASDTSAAIRAFDGLQVDGRAVRVSEAQERGSSPRGGQQGGQRRNGDNA